MAKRALRGSRAVVTGASSGIGRQLTLELTRHGAELLVVARREDKLRQLVAETRAIGQPVDTVVGDITEPSVRQTVIGRVESVWGGLDILVNNAGVSAQGPFESAAPDRLRRIMEVNFFAAAELIRAALPLMTQGDRPLVVNIGSILGYRAVPFNSEYCASKFALRGLSEALRAEFALLGIDVLVVSPGTTDTEFFSHLLERHGEMPWRVGRGVSPARVARATVRAIRRGRHEIIPTWRGRLLVWGNRLVPRFVDRWMRGYGAAPAGQNCSQSK
jgi:short-subunit dehydrogenase